MAEDNKESESFPEEAENTTYERDKTAKEPRAAQAEGEAAPKPKPKIKPRKVFVPKKVKAKTDKPMEHRTRQIVVSSLEAAQAICKIVEEFQEDLAKVPSDDPDKIVDDYDKTEKFFGRLAKKYSLCPSKLVGGDLDWIYKNMPVPDTLTEDIVDTIMKMEKMTLQEPVKSKLGYHILLVCDSVVSKRSGEKKDEAIDPRLMQMLERDRSEIQAPGSDMQIPS